VKRLSWLVCVLILGTAGLVAADEEWPREIQTEKGLVVLYQPQIDSLDGDLLSGRSAVSIKSTGQDEPIFGAAWLEGRIETDYDTRTVTFSRVEVPRVRFQDASDEQQEELAALLTGEIPTWDLELSLDELMASLEIAEQQGLAATDFDDSPPVILFTDEPTVLVSIDGEPRFQELEKTGVQTVVNTPFLIAQDPEWKDFYYLYAGADSWYEARAVKGPWKPTTKVPKKVKQLEPEDEEIEPEDEVESPDRPPAILVATESTELIVSDGQPQFLPIGDGSLLIIKNTESDILRENTTQRIFVLLSGRWFASKSTNGPWDFVPSDALPESFSEIDPDSDYGYLLTWVAGSELAEETSLDSYVPQTAAIKRSATIEVTYDGEPKFEPIEETSLFYAVNTESQVIQAGSKYYCAEDGVWYVADDPKGPWRVASEVPDEIYTIPPSNPNYNVTYVYVYDSTPEVVYVGYYPGYTGSYLYNGCVVYGTGWYYRPWHGRYYYPRYRTWGFSVRWNPWHGWGFGFGISTGRFTFGIGYGGWYRRGWWGPRGYRGYRRGYNRGWHRGYRNGNRAGYRNGYRAGRRDSGRNMYQRSNNAGKVAATGRTQQARSPGASTGRANNVYTDKQGNVYRQGADGNWQQRDGGQWKNSDIGDSGRSRSDAAASQRDGAASGDRQRPSGGERGALSGGNLQNTQGRAAGAEAARSGRSSSSSPSAGSRSSSPPRSSGGSSVNRSSQSRQRGSQRTQSAPRGGSRGGGRRGGGGRR
jgi:hypothetical protein